MKHDVLVAVAEDEVPVQKRGVVAAVIPAKRFPVGVERGAVDLYNQETVENKIHTSHTRDLNLRFHAETGSDEKEPGDDLDR